MADKTPAGSIDPALPANNPFGATANKSLESEQTEVKDAKHALLNEDAAEHEGDKELPETVSVKLFHHVDDEDGNPLLPGETYDLPRVRAEGLISSFRAERADK